MINPANLTLMLLIIPILAVCVQIVGLLLRQDQTKGHSLARIASTTTALFSVVLFVLTAFHSESGNRILTNTIQISDFTSLEFLQDRISIFWLVLNSCLVTHFFWYSKELKQKRSGTDTVLLLTLFALIQGIVLSNDAQLQWMILNLSNWLLYGCLIFLNSSENRSSQSAQVVITLTVADLFWMLGLLGLYLLTGSLDITLLNSDIFFTDLSESATALLITSTISLLISLVIRLGFFPVMVWTNEFHNSSASHALLWTFPISIGGYLLFRWLPVLKLYPEPMTLVIGIAALSSVLLAVSGIFQTGLKQLQRLGSVLISFGVIGIAAHPDLWPQMAALFAGAIIFMITLSYHQQTTNTTIASAIQWGLLLILLCGTSGVEAMLRNLQDRSGETLVEVPPVLLPILVIALGMFLYGIYQQIHREAGSIDAPSSRPTGLMFWGTTLLLFIQGVPFFLSPDTRYEFLFPSTLVILIVLSISITFSIQSLGGLNSFELGSLVKLCRQDYYLPAFFERGLAIPVKIGSYVVHFLDSYLWQGVLIESPRWLLKEIAETGKERDEIETALSRCQMLIFTSVVLILAVWLGKNSF